MKGQIVYIESQCRLSLSNYHLVYRTETEEKSFLLADLSAVVFESPMISVTLALFNELQANGVIVLLCDSRKFPSAMLMPLFGTADAFQKSEAQFSWTKEQCDGAWRQIIVQKIANQSALLKEKGIGFPVPKVNDGDPENVEGIYAGQYFRSLFGRGFRRHLQDDINAALNYGYTVLLSAMARVIASHGYLLQCGIHHKGANNPYNFACDLVEPFRPIVDACVSSRGGKLDKEYKLSLISCLQKTVSYDQRRFCVMDAMEAYFHDVVNFLDKKKSKIGELMVIGEEGFFGIV